MNDSAGEARPLLLPEQQLVDNNQIIEGWRRTLPPFVASGNQPQFPYLLPMHMGPEGEGGGGVTDAGHDFPTGTELHKHPNQRICKDTMNNGEDVPVGAERSDGESDADEEVRSLDLPPHMGVDLRSKRTLGRGQRGSVHPQQPEEDMRDHLSPQPERPMSWEGELSDHEFHPVQSASAGSYTHPHLNGAAGIKLEPLDIEVPAEEGGVKCAEPGDNEVVDMEGVQSAGPCSPQPLIHPTAHPLNNNVSGHVLPQGVLTYTAPTTPQTSRHEWEHSNNNKYYDNQGELRRQSCRSPVNIVPTPRLPCPPYTSEVLGGPTPLPSPLLTRHPTRLPLAHHPPTPSPDSAIHSAYYSPTASPGQSRHRSSSGLSSPYSHRASPSLSRNNSDASQYSQYGGSGSQYSYSSAPSPLSPSPAQSPVQPRHMAILAAANGFPSPVMGRAGAGLHLEYPPSPLLLRHHGSYPGGVGSASREVEIKAEGGVSSSGTRNSAIGSLPNDAEEISREGLLLDDKGCPTASDLSQHSALSAQAGISRQQLINSPCPICGDKISGFHYGIFSCESCKGFFKRTVQNKKNYVCLRGAACPVTIATRKKCPACRFDKCLTTGMKLEAIREDRTRGGRSTYQCTYALPPSVLSPTETNSSSKSGGAEASSSSSSSSNGGRNVDDWGQGSHSMNSGLKEETKRPVPIPPLLLEIIGVEHLWNTQEGEGRSERRPAPVLPPNLPSNDPEYLASLCSMADHRLYKIVKWCKSLPLFKHIHIDDQISLLINTWCELLLFACCFRSIPTPGEIRVSVGKTLTLEQGRAFGIGACIERMLHLTEHLRRLKLDQYEYAAMKVIILLSSDTSNLKEPESVRASQESVLQALQQYTLTHYPEMASKFGELLLRIPELERTCQVGKEMLTLKREGDGQGFNLLMELLRGDY